MYHYARLFTAFVVVLVAAFDARSGHGERWVISTPSTSIPDPVLWSPDGSSISIRTAMTEGIVRIMKADGSDHQPTDLDVCRSLQTGGGQGPFTVQGLLNSDQLLVLAEPPATAPPRPGRDLWILGGGGPITCVDSCVARAMAGRSGERVFYERYSAAGAAQREIVAYDRSGGRRTTILPDPPDWWRPVDEDRRIIGYRSTGMVELVDATDGTELARWSAPLHARGRILAVRSNPRGTVVYALVARDVEGGGERIMCVAMDAVTGVAFYECLLLQTSVTDIYDFDVCSDGQLLAFSERGLGRVRIHRLPEGTVVDERRASGEMTVHGWSPEGHCLAVSAGRDIRTYAVAHNGTMSEGPTFGGHYPRGEVAVDELGVIAFERTYWSVASTGFSRYAPATSLNKGRSILAMTASCRTGVVITQASESTAFHDVEVVSTTGAVLRRIERAVHRGCAVAAMMSDERGDLIVVHRPSDGWVGVVDLQTRDTLLSTKSPITTPGSIKYAVITGRTGQLLIGSAKHTLLVDLADGRPIPIPQSVIEGISRASARIPLSADGLIDLGSDGRVRIYDPSTGDHRQLDLPDGRLAGAASFTRNGRHLIVWSREGDRLWRFATSNGLVEDVVVLSGCHPMTSGYDLDWHEPTNTYSLRYSTDQILVVRQKPTSAKEHDSPPECSPRRTFHYSGGDPLVITPQSTGRMDVYTVTGERVATLATTAGEQVALASTMIRPGLHVVVESDRSAQVINTFSVLITK